MPDGKIVLKKIGRAAVVAALLCSYMALTSFLFGSVCVAEATIGLPCPGCGLTRAWLAALSLDFGRAFSYHPLFLIPPAFVAVYIYKKVKRANARTKWFDAVCVTVLLAFGVTYAVRMFLYFPETEPMVINRDSMLWRFVRLAGRLAAS